MVTAQDPLGVASFPAPADWAGSTSSEHSSLHQLAPYIGKLKPTIARQLVAEFTQHGDTVMDCFAGSGTIPLEALLLGRSVIAYDVNPYALTLTRAKLEAPSSIDTAIHRLRATLGAAQEQSDYDPSAIPEWVSKFFHPRTLQNALKFADACIERDDQFLLACLLGILHHQRPGFLSYPSSHLVPYLRDRKYPKDTYPHLYEERELAPRLEAKIVRAYRRNFVADKDRVLTVERAGVTNIRLDGIVDAIVTSPPYMNALDYVRDNRLRMWFVDRSTTNYSPEPTEKLAQSDVIIDAFSDNVLPFLKPGGRCILVIGETVRRKRVTSHPAERILSRLVAKHPALLLDKVIHDDIPDVRRSRRNASATKRELILVMTKQ